jgi:hypothetical protein
MKDLVRTVIYHFGMERIIIGMVGAIQNHFNSRVLVRPEDCAICEPSRTPSVLDPKFRPKYPTSTDPSSHRQVHPHSPKWARLRPSYSSAHLKENGHGKDHQGVAYCGR